MKSKQPGNNDINSIPVGNSYSIARTYIKWAAVLLTGLVLIFALALAPFAWNHYKKQSQISKVAGVSDRMPLTSAVSTRQPKAHVKQLMITPVVNSATKPRSVLPQPKSQSQMTAVPTILPSLTKKVVVTEVKENRWGEARQHYTQAIDMLAHGLVSAATNKLWEILQFSPEYMPARIALIKLLIDSPKPLVAQSLLNYGLLQDQANIELIELKARLLVKQDHFKQALKLLERFSPSLADYPDYYALIAYIDEKMGKAAMAVALYNQLLRLDQKNPTWWLGLGVALRNIGKNNAAAQAFRQSLLNQNIDTDPKLRTYAVAQLQELQSGG